MTSYIGDANQVIHSSLQTVAKKFPKTFSREIEWLIHPIVLLMNDIKKTVASKAKATLETMCFTCGNKDLIGSGKQKQLCDNVSWGRVRLVWHG